MRVVHSKTPLPRDWSRFARKAVLEADIAVMRFSRLRMKLLVFNNKTDLRVFWKKLRGYGESLGWRCLGVVNGLATEIRDYRKGEPERRRMEVDPRYFAIVGLVKGHLSMEVICHESVHAGFCYSKRVYRRDLWKPANDFDEEQVCYPAGRIASAINRAIDNAGLYPWSKKS